MNIHNPTSSSTTTITSATRISLVTSQSVVGNLEGFNDYSGDEGHCPHIGTGVFVKNSGSTKKNLIFRLTVTGQQGPKPNTNDEQPESEDFTCSYSASLDLLHGGEGWAQGDFVTHISWSNI